jgi:hypothetical protein
VVGPGNQIDCLAGFGWATENNHAIPLGRQFVRHFGKSFDWPEFCRAKRRSGMDSNHSQSRTKTRDRPYLCCGGFIVSGGEKFHFESSLGASRGHGDLIIDFDDRKRAKITRLIPLWLDWVGEKNPAAVQSLSDPF